MPASATTCALLLLTLLAGCSQGYRNVPLNALDAPPAQWRVNQTRAGIAALPAPERPTTRPVGRDTDGVFVGVAISGGGSRSANFAAGVLFELEKVGLLDRVDYISAVSGGSLTAAHYCTAPDDQWRQGAVQAKLTHPYASDVVRRVFLPWNALGLALSGRNRTDVLADEFNRVTLARPDGRSLTFADLRADRPRLLLNTTDIASGRRFVFGNEEFDAINSDLSVVPLGQAVAASAAVPVLFHPVALRDHSTRFKQYRHLVDGGVADNLGLTSLLEAYEAHKEHARTTALPPPYPRGAVFVVIDSRTSRAGNAEGRSEVGFWQGIVLGSQTAVTQLINRVSAATLADAVVNYCADDAKIGDVRRQLAQLKSTGFTEMTDRDGRRVRIVHFALERARDLKELPSEGFAEVLNAISTDFDISAPHAHALYLAARLLMRDHFAPVLEPVTREILSPKP